MMEPLTTFDPVHAQNRVNQLVALCIALVKKAGGEVTLTKAEAEERQGESTLHLDTLPDGEVRVRVTSPSDGPVH